VELESLNPIYVLWIATGAAIFILGQVFILGVVFYKFKALEKIMSTTPAGLAALIAAVAALTTAVQTASTELASLAAQLLALNSEDPQVATIAAQVQAQATALNNASAAANSEPPAAPAAPAD
jgi:hypothetical protein